MKPNAHISSWGETHPLPMLFWMHNNQYGIWGMRVWVQSLGHALGSVQAGGTAENTSEFAAGVASTEGVCSCTSKFQNSRPEFS